MKFSDAIKHVMTGGKASSDLGSIYYDNGIKWTGGTNTIELTDEVLNAEWQLR